MKSIKDTLLIVKDAIDRYSIETRTKAYSALIGGHAAVFFGAERTTLDVDICFHAAEKQPGLTFFRFLRKHLPSRYAVRIIEATKDPSDPLKHDLSNTTLLSSTIRSKNIPTSISFWQDISGKSWDWSKPASSRGSTLPSCRRRISSQ